MTRTRRWVGLIVAVVACYAVAAIGGWATSSSVRGWYQTLQRPPIAPPDWVFGPVWTLLYTMMAVAVWRVWQTQPPNSTPEAQAAIWRRRGLVLFAVQLLLNLLWSFVFFAWQQIDAAVVEIALLWLAIVACTAAFWKVDRLAAWLMVPYGLWVAFAAVLNAWIAALN